MLVITTTADKKNPCPLPRRVLDVGGPDNSVESHLVENSDKAFCQYLTLSHCWGGKVPITTTTETLPSQLQHIPLSSLPRTFKEAVDITKNLGFRYLWIDSLCILQDSKDDWEEQSVLMCDIYSNALLNIAARGAPDATFGCFIGRSQDPPACRIPYSVQECPHEGWMYIRSPAYKHERLRETPLDQRGWVVQERALSSRIIHFGAEQLYWECKEVTKRQDGNDDDMGTNDLRAFHDFKSDMRIDRKFFAGGLLSPGSPQFRKWYLMAEEYTKRHLTYDSDMLPAISGLAKVFHTMSGCTYVAGIRKEYIVLGLSWYTGRRSRRANEALPNADVPSWSWAKQKGPTYNHASAPWMLAEYIRCKLVNLHFDVVSKNSYGNVRDAKATLEGHVFQVLYNPRVEHGRYLLSDICTTDGEALGEISIDPGELLETGRIIHCLLLYDSDLISWALALVPSLSSPGTFRRIGRVSINTKGKGQSWFPKILDLQTITLV